MVNCNPETVSTDYDTSDKLYFEPLTVEDVLSIYEKEKPEGVIVQFGGQTPLNIANELAQAGVKIIGTSPEAIDLAEDRDRFRQMMAKLGIPMPESGMASNLDDAIRVAERIGYPLMVRPSYVLGGRGMEVIHDEEMLKHYVAAAVGVTPKRPNIVDGIKNKEIQLVINTPSGKLSKYDDSYIRKTAIKYKIPYITTLAAAIAAAKGIAAYRQGKGSVRSLQSYHGDIK